MTVKDAIKEIETEMAWLREKSLLGTYAYQHLTKCLENIKAKEQ